MSDNPPQTPRQVRQQTLSEKVNEEVQGLFDAWHTFFAASWSRLFEKARQGWTGWDDPKKEGELKRKLYRNALEGDWVDVGNLALFLHHLEADGFWSEYGEELRELSEAVDEARESIRQEMRQLEETVQQSESTARTVTYEAKAKGLNQSLSILNSHLEAEECEESGSEKEPSYNSIGQVIDWTEENGVTKWFGCMVVHISPDGPGEDQSGRLKDISFVDGRLQAKVQWVGDLSSSWVPVNEVYPLNRPLEDHD